MCNCSLCRKKAGQLATGILTPLAKTSGFGSVSEYLTNSKDDIAACLQWKAEKDASTPVSKKSKIVKKTKSPQKKIVKARKTPSPKKTSCTRRSATKNRYTTRSSVSSTSSEVEVVSPRRGSDRWSLRPQPRVVQPLQYSNSVDSDSDYSDEEEQVPVPPKPITDENQNSTLISTIIESPQAHSSEEDSDSDMSEADERMQRQLQLSFLKKKWKDCESEQKKESLRRQQDERKQLKLQQKMAKEEEKAKLKESRKQKQAEERILKQEQLRKLVTEKRQERMLEKQAKEEQLRKLKEQKREEKKRLETAVNVSLSEPLSFVANSSKDVHGFLDLPTLPAWDVDLDYRSVSCSIELWSFLQQFKEVIKCAAVDTFDTFIQTLSSGGGPIDLYSSLLKLLLPEEDPNRAVVDQTLVPLSKGVCNRILREYVAECVSDESAPPKLLDNFPPKSTQDHLAIAIFLVGEVLLQEEVTEFILKSASSVREMRRELKTWQKAKTKEISDKLMDMNERNCSVEQLIKEREECLKAVTTERNELLLQQQSVKNRLRITPLGEDRHGRLYWSIPGLAHLLVEDSEHEKWMEISTKELLEEFMACLDAHNENEMHLLSSITVLHSSLTEVFCN
jgi:hypothetical protein